MYNREIVEVKISNSTFQFVGADKHFSETILEIPHPIRTQQKSPAIMPS